MNFICLAVAIACAIMLAFNGELLGATERHWLGFSLAFGWAAFLPWGNWSWPFNRGG